MTEANWHADLSKQPTEQPDRGMDSFLWGGEMSWRWRRRPTKATGTLPFHTNQAQARRELLFNRGIPSVRVKAYWPKIRVLSR